MDALAGHSVSSGATPAKQSPARHVDPTPFGVPICMLLVAVYHKMDDGMHTKWAVYKKGASILFASVDSPFARAYCDTMFFGGDLISPSFLITHMSLCISIDSPDHNPKKRGRPPTAGPKPFGLLPPPFACVMTVQTLVVWHTQHDQKDFYAINVVSFMQVRMDM